MQGAVHSPECCPESTTVNATERCTMWIPGTPGNALSPLIRVHPTRVTPGVWFILALGRLGSGHNSMIDDFHVQVVSLLPISLFLGSWLHCHWSEGYKAGIRSNVIKEPADLASFRCLRHGFYGGLYHFLELRPRGFRSALGECCIIHPAPILKSISEEFTGLGFP